MDTGGAQTQGQVSESHEVGVAIRCAWAPNRRIEWERVHGSMQELGCHTGEVG